MRTWKDGLSRLALASDGYEGTCRIWRETHYYAGQCNAPGDGYYRRSEDDPGEGRVDDVWEGSYAEAKQILDAHYNGSTCYEGIAPSQILSHGQAAGDTMTIVVAD